MSYDTELSKDIEMQIVQRDGAVILLFSRYRDGALRAAQTDNMKLDPAVAIRAAQCLTDMAFEADTGLKPVAPTLKAELANQHRMTVTQKLATILQTYREDKTYSHGKLAQLCAEEAINDIFS